MTTERRRLGLFRFTNLGGIAAAVALVIAGSTPATAQQRGKDAGKDAAKGSLAVVTHADVFVRSNPADSYYPFGKLKRGDVVMVTGERYKFARVLTMGPAFKDFFGYIRHPRDSASPLKIAPDGKKARTLGKTDVLAPNLNTNYKPSDSWKRILSLPANAEVTILQTFESDRNVVHKVVLPEQAEGWVSTAQLVAAGPEQIAAWDKAMRGGGQAVADAGQKKATPKPEAEQPPAVASATPKPTTPRAMPREEPTVKPVVEKPTPAAPQTVMAQPTQTGLDETAEHMAQPEPNRPAAIDPAPAAKPAPELAKAMDAEARLEALESAFEIVKGEPIHTAEVIPLRDLYRALRAESDTPKVVHVAGSRAEQLAIWADLQARRMELRRIKAQLETKSGEAEALRRAFETSGPYAVVGKLMASTIYDGARLPRLFRVQDEITGRTMAYLRPTDDFDLEGMLGQTTGIVGDMHYEGTLRVKLITPRRIDLLGSTAASADN
jgi:hypothetical protein